MSDLDISKIPAPVLASLESQGKRLIEDAMGFTVERAASFLAESKAEAAAGDGETDTRGDAIGKFKHYLRTERHWEAAADILWGSIESFAAELVDAAIAAGA